MKLKNSLNMDIKKGKLTLFILATLESGAWFASVDCLPIRTAEAGAEIWTEDPVFVSIVRPNSLSPTDCWPVVWLRLAVED